MTKKRNWRESRTRPSWRWRPTRRRRPRWTTNRCLPLPRNSCPNPRCRCRSRACPLASGSRRRPLTRARLIPQLRCRPPRPRLRERRPRTPFRRLPRSRSDNRFPLARQPASRRLRPCLPKPQHRRRTPSPGRKVKRYRFPPRPRFRPARTFVHRNGRPRQRRPRLMLQPLLRMFPPRPVNLARHCPPLTTATRRLPLQPRCPFRCPAS